MELNPYYEDLDTINMFKALIQTADTTKAFELAKGPVEHYSQEYVKHMIGNLDRILSKLDEGANEARLRKLEE